MDAIYHRLSWHGLIAYLWLSALVGPVYAAWEPDPAFGLGAAARFAVLSLGKPSSDTDGQSKLDLSAVTVHGDVGVGPHGTLDFQGPSTINGDLYLDSTLLPQDIISDAGVLTGSRITRDLSDAVTDALNAADTNADLPPTQTLGRLSSSMTIFGEGGVNVIAIDGFDYAGSSATNPLTLTLMGGESDVFVLNVSGKFVLGPSSGIRGVDPSRVLINVSQGNTPVQLASNSYVGGTLLSPYRKMGPLQGASGPVLGARVLEISLVGGAVLNPPPLAPLAVIVADQTVAVDTPARLDGSASTAPYGDPLSFSWSLLEQPIDSIAQLSNDTVVNPYFIPDLPGDYLVQLVVCDGSQVSEPAVVTIAASEPSEGVDLSLEITDDPDPVVSKQSLFYTLTITNESLSPASDVVLVGSLNGDIRGTPVAEPIDQCSYSTDGKVTCLLGDLAGNEAVGVLVRLTPKRPGVVSVDGNVSAAGEDPDPADNSDREETLVIK